MSEQSTLEKIENGLKGIVGLVAVGVIIYAVLTPPEPGVRRSGRLSFLQSFFHPEEAPKNNSPHPSRSAHEFIEQWANENSK